MDLPALNPSRRGGPVTHRPERLVLVVGTGTEVGKTWVACRLARVLRRRGLIVAARKPAQSYDPGDDLSETDASPCWLTPPATTRPSCAPSTAGPGGDGTADGGRGAGVGHRSPWPTW